MTRESEICLLRYFSPPSRLPKRPSSPVVSIGLLLVGIGLRAVLRYRHLTTPENAIGSVAIARVGVESANRRTPARLAEQQTRTGFTEGAVPPRFQHRVRGLGLVLLENRGNLEYSANEVLTFPVGM